MNFNFSFNCVCLCEIVGPKQQKKFRKLVMGRIKWSEDSVSAKDSGKLHVDNCLNLALYFSCITNSVTASTEWHRLNIDL